MDCERQLLDRKYTFYGFRALLRALSHLSFAGILVFWVFPWLPLTSIDRVQYSGVCMILTATFHVWWYFAKEKSYAKAFEWEYHTHKLNKYPWQARGLYLHYALFLRQLVTQRLSRDEIVRLKRFAETLEPVPRLDLQLSKDPVFMWLVGLSSGIAVSWIKDPALWSNAGWRVTLVSILAWGLVAAIGRRLLVRALQIGPHRPEYRRQVILRFLQWAEEDITDKNLTKDNEHTC
jgi:hypothetical protein